MIDEPCPLGWRDARCGRFGPCGCEPTGAIYNKGVAVEREGRRRFAVISNGHRWGHFLLRRDAEQFAEDVRRGRAFFSEAGQLLLQRRDGD